jgi:hypothetical protein
MSQDPHVDVDRRGFLGVAGTFAAASFLGGADAEATAQSTGRRTTAVGSTPRRRRLGRLEVSSVGLGVQNMSRTYQTTIPSRPGMLKITRAAFDQGVTFFDAAEAYGPHEVERILGEGVAPFRDKVVIATKFGFDIDFDTGQMRGGLNSKPDHVKLAVDAMRMSGVEAPPKA